MRLVEVVRLGSSSVLLFAGGSKIGSRSGFRQLILTVLGNRFRFPVSVWIFAGIGLELLAGLLLLVPWTSTLLAGAVATGMVGVTIVGISSYAVARGIAVPCGCFGSVGVRPLGIRNIGIGSALVVVATLLVWASIKKSPFTSDTFYRSATFVSLLMIVYSYVTNRTLLMSVAVKLNAPRSKQMSLNLRAEP